MVIDPGVLGTPQTGADITRAKVAESGGKVLEELITLSQSGADRNNATEVMRNGASKIVRGLHFADKVDGIIALGGSTGTAIGTTVMKTLPIGVPKLMVSTYFYSDYVGEKDITMMQTPADIAGLNRIMKRSLSQAAGAIVGMVESSVPDEEVKPLIGITGLGVTTPAVMKIRNILEGNGYETVVFHNKTGVLDELIEEGTIKGVIDLTPNELIGIHIMKTISDRADRLNIAGEKGLPQMICPGGLDMIIFNTSKDNIPDKFRTRRLSTHGPHVTLARTNEEENSILGKIIAKRANEAKGEVRIVIPLRGFSEVDKEGQVFHDPGIDRVLSEVVKENVKEPVKVIEIDVHINDDEFAGKAVDIFGEINAGDK